MRIDPYAWVLMFPITLALVQLWFQPRDHLLKRWWRQANQLESMTWERLGWSPATLFSAGPKRERTLFAAIIAGFGLAALASLGAFLGVLPSS